MVNEPVIPVEESLPPAPVAAENGQAGATGRDSAPKPTKRNSLFGNLFNKVTSPSHEKTEKDVAPAVPAKDTETTPVSAAAPQLADPTDTSAAQPVATTGETAPVSAGTTSTPRTLTSSSPPKGGIFAFMKQKDAKHEVSPVSNSLVR